MILDHANGAVRDTLPADEDGRFIPFQKQRDEMSKLILGSDEAVAAVRTAFKMRYKDGVSYRTIALKFNELGYKPFHAPYWHPTTLATILLNPIYLGRALACRWAFGVHYVLGKDRPQVTPVKQSDFEDTGRSSIDPIHRPRDEWFERDEEHLLHFINDPDVRKKAQAVIDVDLEKFNRPKRPRGAHFKGVGARGDHRHTPYILRDLLRSADGGFALTGRTQGNKEYGRRTYVAREYLGGNPKALHLSQYVPAPPVEAVVVSTLRELFQKNLDLKALVSESVSREQSKQHAENLDETALRSEDQSLARKTTALINASPDPSAEDVQKQLNAWKVRRQQIKRQLDGIENRTRKVDVDAITQQTLSTLLTPGDKLDGEGRFRLRQLINAWCQDMKIDITTRDLELAVRVPPMWALDALVSGRDLCIEYGFTRLPPRKQK